MQINKHCVIGPSDCNMENIKYGACGYCVIPSSY